MIRNETQLLVENMDIILHIPAQNARRKIIFQK